VKEKLRKNHGIHKNYTVGQKLIVEKYWLPFFKGRLLGSITREDIENFIDDLAERKLSAGRKNTILKAGTIPLRWAFSKEVIEKDIVVGISARSCPPGLVVGGPVGSCISARPCQGYLSGRPCRVGLV
jgi:hypothetical protein